MTRLMLTVLIFVGALAICTAPAASAECTYTSGVTICAQGNVEGGSSEPVASSGPYYPYPCEDDWLCDDGGVSIAVGGPGIDIGLPGRPGHRPR